MDLVSSIRKSGSRGGVNFSWDEVASSAHRENYLGHSLKAPVGRWQQGRDLEWYAKNKDADDGPSDETPEERAARERREEIKRVKEAEEDALARALGLPVKQRDQTGANSVEIAKPRIGPQETRTDGTGGDTGVIAAAGTIDPTDHQEEGKMTVAERETSAALPVDELPVKSEAMTGDSIGDTMMIVAEMNTSEEGILAGTAVPTGAASTTVKGEEAEPKH
ncbi:hypothetical protein LQW54_006488 [Pestalotiopsis sp. IQ-011]